MFRFQLRVVACLTLLCFVTTQTGFSQETINLLQSSAQAVKETDAIPNAELPPDPDSVRETSQEFLEDTLALTPLISKKQSKKEKTGNPVLQNYEYERYDFQDALDLLRPEYAAAVIVKDISAENLKDLLKLSFETAVLVLHGEIVLLTSGSSDEIGVLPAVKALTEKASFISHTHPNEHSAEGPSGQDINEAVSTQEYVVTERGAYVYNNKGLLNDGKTYSYERYVDAIFDAVEVSRTERGQVEARKDLNRFIAEQDRFNEASAEERITFRRGGNFSPTSGLSTSNVTTLPGTPRPYYVSGSTPATSLSSGSSDRVTMDFSVTSASEISGVAISFDDASTTGTPETINIMNLTNLVLGLKGPNSSVRLEVVDINGVTDNLFALTGISNSTELFWQIPVTSISTALDRTKIKQLNFIVAQENTSVQTGSLTVRLKGMNLGTPATPAVTSTVPVWTNQTTLTLSGTKEAHTSILINNAEVVALNGSTTWQATISLPSEGNNSVSVKAKNSIGKTSSQDSYTVKRDTVAPVNATMTLQGNAQYATSTSVSLTNLGATDAASTIDKMSFSNDGTNWTTPETIVAGKSHTLLSGDGGKTVYVKYTDKAGNYTIVTKTISLETLPPSGSINVNGGAQFIAQTSANLNLSASDAGSGMNKMKFSSDGTNWTAEENYAAAKSWNFSSGDGNKTVYVKFSDVYGRWSDAISTSVILDTTYPQGTLAIGSSEFTGTRDVTVTLSATDFGSGLDQMTFSMDGGNTWSGWETFSAVKTLTLPSGEGSKQVMAAFKDKIGFTSYASDTITLDTVKPWGSININNNAAMTSSRDVTLNLAAWDALSGVDKMRFSTDGGQTWSAWENPVATINFTLPAGDGSKEVRYELKDKAGNSDVFSDSITLDTTPPAISISVNEGAQFTNSRNVQLHITASDAISGVWKIRFTTDTVNWIWGEWQTTFQSPVNYTLPEGDGNYEVFYQAYDNLSNLNSAHDAITLDTTAPSGSVSINGGAGMTLVPDVTLTLTASDAVSGVDKVRFSTDGGQSWTAWENYSASKELTLPGNPGNKEVRYQVRDLANHISTFTDTISFDAQDYERTLEDGTRLFYEANVLVRELTPDNHEVFYAADGGVLKFRYSTGEEIRYLQDGTNKIQITNTAGTVIETLDKPVPAALNEAAAVKTTLEGGLNAFYVDGALVELRTSAGIRVTNIVLNEDFEIQSALLVYPNGMIEVIRKGFLVRRLNADGSIYDFTPKSFLVREIVSSTVQYYDFNKKSQTTVLATRIFTKDGRFSRYDELGILREVQGESDKHFIYNRSLAGGEYISNLDLTASSVPAEKALVQAVYSETGTLKKMVLENGDQIFIEDGKIARVLDAQNIEINYSYLENEELLSGVQITRAGNQFKYDDKGFLSQINTSSGIIHRSQADTNGDGLITEEDEIKLLLEADGNTLSDFELDEDGKILNGIIRTKEGVKQRIQNGVLTGFETVDGKIYEMQETATGRKAVLTEWNMSDGSRVLYGGESISEILFPDGKRLHTIGFGANREIETVTEELQDGTEKFFQKNKLVKIVTPAGAQIFYDLAGFAEKIILPDATEEQVSYLRGADGTIQEIIFTGEHANRVFKADGTLLRLLTDGVSAEITNNEVSRLFTRFGEVENPEFDNEQIMSGTIQFNDGSQQIIENGILKETILPTGAHVFYTNGRITRIETVKGEYGIIYNPANSTDIQSAFIKLMSKPGTPQYPLMPYLMEPQQLLFGNSYQDDAFIPGGNVKTDGPNSKFGSSGVYFDGSGDFIQLPDGSQSDFQYGSGNFTVDFWFQPERAGVYQMLWSQYTGGSTNNNMALYLDPNNKLVLSMQKYGQWWMDSITSPQAASLGEWYHTAVVRNGNTVSLYLNGQLQGSSNVFSPDYPATNFSVSFGSGFSGSGWDSFFKGSMDEIRISKGIARWTSNFTAPAEEYKRDANTTRLFHFLTEEDFQPLDSELNEIFLSKKPYNVLAEDLDIKSTLKYQGQSVSLSIVKTTEDAERGMVYEFGSDYVPTWDVSTTYSYSNGGGIFRDNVFDINDHQPAKTAGLIDIDGDGLPDRVYAHESGNITFWYVQFNKGSYFAAPVQWTGVEPQYDPSVAQWYGETHGALEFYSGRHPQKSGDLVDINGDGLPDRIMTKYGAQWYVQINNGQGFNPLQVWETNIEPVYIYGETITVVEAWDSDGYNNVQPMNARLIDMDGDGLPDRIVRPVAPPYNVWLYQRNNGHGFDDTIVWTGLDTTFDPNPKTAGSIVWYALDNRVMGDLSDLVDMNGDQKPDRLLLKLKTPGNEQSGYDWYVQFNNGEGFDPAVLWDSSVRNVPGDWSGSYGSTLRLFDFNYAAGKRSIITDLKDVNGDGLVDRVSIDNYNNSGGYTPKTIWWVELNTGAGFAAAAAWTGIEGDDMAQTSLGQDDWHRRSFGCCGYGREPGNTITGVSDLVDLNGDKIPDHVFFKENQSKWYVQYGTGTGFLPAQAMKLNALTIPVDEIASSNYDYVHVSLKAAADIPASSGVVKVTLGDPAVAASYQEWTISPVGSNWQEFYLPIDKNKSNSSKVQISFEPAAGQNPNVALYADNLTFTGLRPAASKDWLDRVLTEENILAEVYSDRTQTLAQYLGLSEAGAATAFDWSRLLSAETEIDFNDDGEAEQFQTLYGSVSKIENGRIVETIMPDGSKVQFEAVNENNPQSTTQTIVNSDGSTHTVNLTYDRVRTVSRPGKSPLEYSYEFNAAGEEITVVRDPETNVKERYQTVNNAVRMLSRTHANNVTHEFIYNALGVHVETHVMYKGRLQETYKHGKTAQGLTTVTTEAGMIEEYDASGKLAFRTTPEGYRYAHSFENAREVNVTYVTETMEYEGAPAFSVQVPYVTLEDCVINCQEVHRETLVSYKSALGDLAGYKDRALTSLMLAGGTRMSFSNFEIIESAPDAQTGEVTTEVRLLDAIVFHTDGTITEFRNGIPYSVTSATGRVISLAMSGGELNNANESAVFHKSQAAKIWNDLVKPQWLKYQLDDTFSFQMEYDSEGRLVTRQFAEGVMEVYEEGRIIMTLDPEGERLVRNEYDSEGNPILIQQEGSRRRLDSTVLKVRADVAVERQKTLARLALRHLALDQIIEGKYLMARDRLLAIRAQIEAQRNEIANTKVKGKQGKSMLSDILQQMQGGLDQVNNALTQLAQERIDALEQLNAQVLEVSNEIETKTLQAYADIAVEENKIRLSILRQEISPIIYHWYRKIMGRDPSTAEYDVWINSTSYESQSFNLAGLKQSLQNSSELAARQVQVQAIKNAVQADLQYYLGLNNAERQAYASALGIDAGLAVELTAQEGTAIETWLLSRSLHFGQSAFIALESLLTNASLSFERVELARKLILIDILTGVISPLETGELLISTYAMRKVAASYGLSVSPMGLTYTGLKAMYDDVCSAQPSSCNFRMIAHIDSNHYIIITKVTDSQVTFTDPGAGAENALQVQTISKADFMQAWQATKLSAGWGYVISARPPPAALAAQEYRQLSNTEQMAVRGAFFGFFKTLFKIFAYAFLAVFVTPVFLASLILDDLRVSIKNYINALGDFFGDLYTFDYKNAFTRDIKVLFKTSIDLGKQLLSLPTDLLGKSLRLLGFSEKTTQTIIAGIKIVVGVVLMFVPGGQGFGASLIISGTSDMLRLHTNLSPTVINIISIAAAVVAVFAGSGFDAGSLSGAIGGLKSQLPFFAREFASAGVMAIGNAIGLDPRISSLISIPIRAAVGNGVSSLTHANSINSASLMAAVKNGLYAGAQSIGQYFSGQTNSLLGSLQSGKILGSVESSLGTSGLFSGILEVLKKSALSPLNSVSGMVELSLKGFTSFSSLIESKGVIGAFTSAAASIFSRQTIERLLSLGGVSGVLSSAVKVLTVLDGQNVQEQDLGGGTSLFYDLLGNFIGKKENGTTQIGAFGITGSGKWGLISGKIIATLLGDKVFAGEISGGQFMRGSLSDGGGIFATFDPEKPGGVIEIDGRDPNPGSGIASFFKMVFKFLPLAVDYIFTEGVLKSTQVKQATQSGAASSSIISKITKNLFGNGFNNDVVPEGTFDTLIPSFVLDLNIDGIIKLFETMIIPLYETTDLFGNMADWTSDFLANMQSESWWGNLLAGGIQGLANLHLMGPVKAFLQQTAFGVSNGLVEEVWSKMVTQETLRGRLERGIAFSHSGFFSPLISALAKPKPDNTYFDVETIINYEGVHPGFINHSAYIDNPFLKRIINVWGTGADFAPPVFSISDAAFTGPFNINNINIEIVGARHNDFSFDPLAWSLNPSEEERKAREINRLTNLFMRDVYNFTVEDQTNPGALLNFLSLDSHVNYDAAREVWVVDFGNV